MADSSVVAEIDLSRLALDLFINVADLDMPPSQRRDVIPFSNVFNAADAEAKHTFI